jgi:glycosyltransferase involved in cell wall biosynthesis
MPLNIIDDTETIELSHSKDGTYDGAMGGTELMNKALYERVDNDLLDEFYIIKSRVSWIDKDKPNVLWLHDTWDDPEVQHLKEQESRDRFAKLVFVSNYQLATYNLAMGVPYKDAIVLRNAIDPIEYKEKDKDVIRIIYHTTPHRGLNLVIAAVKAIAEEMGDKIHLDVYSSFEAYGWKERDKPYEDLFEEIRQHPQMTYHGFQSNDVVRSALQEAHIFAYPSVWPETSCISAIEAMSAGCEVVCPNFAALPETTGNFARMYQFNEDMNEHANTFANQLFQAIVEHRDENLQKKLMFQKNWVDNFYNWDLRAAEWTDMLQSIKR